LLALNLSRFPMKTPSRLTHTIETGRPGEHGGYALTGVEAENPVAISCY
jgi:hypothetical protein